MRPGKTASPAGHGQPADRPRYPAQAPKEHLIRMYRQLTAPFLLVAAIALIVGCQASSPAAP